MYRILVTGKSSFIGRAFQARCADFPDRYRVDAISLRGSAWRAADFSGYDAVVHAAGIAHVRARDAMEGAYMAVNRDLAVDVAQKAKAAGVSQFLFLSSMLVYGSPAPAGKSRVIDARTAPAPENAYARSKLFAEEGIRALEGDGFRAAILRPPMVYGKGCRGNYQTLAIWARRLPLFPNIEGARSVIYVEHLAELMRLIIEDGAAGVFCPQNAECASATILLREIARVHARRIAFTRAFNPLIRALGAQPLLRRAFGGLEYDRALSDYPRDYRVCGFSESIIRTEE